ncbi:tRNA (Guanine37-N(1)-) methyltransferase [Humidesulfovibrio mexicanus]|uniref:tRNA (guanine-N(1)-)-methyltransferase n=1 Tax=Humidesulfovibrio mexicanus TaxID=147047 RepID=A0A238ZWG1_9BACT|nr:tRNA (guanosine(37)-N1)-methyltransferase TrmD [Humidesulfovibrio mexicanus]SNR87331.1 tRNA (Guanine37-N(1)-) methyltransferase [Humidesulfovibrio mexicanus]
MRFTILTLFPEFFQGPLTCAQMARAREAGIVDFALVNPRDFSTGRYCHVDDRPYGGGPGMVMQPEPLERALASVERPGRKIVLAPSGRQLTQSLARELAREEALTLVCGRYEGIDERLIEAEGLEAIGVGEAVLNGGEAAALCLVEAVARLLPGFMGKEESGEDESFSHGLLEHPHYTRPEEYLGRAVPEVLRGGSHAAIARWRREASLARTLARRPEMLREAPLDGADINFLRGLAHPAALGRGLFLCLLHHPVLDKAGKTATVSLTNLDIHDMCRVSRTYELGGAFFVTPLDDQRELGQRLLDHWTEGPGGQANPDRGQALRLGRMAASLDEVLERVAARTGRTPRLVATSARAGYRVRRGRKERMIAFTPPGVVRGWLEREPVVLVLGTGHGLAPEVLERSDAVLTPVRGFSRYNHLPVRAAAAILADRLLGDAG